MQPPLIVVTPHLRSSCDRFAIKAQVDFSARRED
jgi:hypothetical protein